MSIVVGEGTYGCVHKPTLKCKDKRTPVKNKVSKVLYSEDAKKEVGEYAMISKIDKKKEYHLGKPILCKPDDSASNLDAISKCTLKGNEYLANKDKLSLLIMEYGGENIEEFVSKINRSNSPSVEMIEHFWIDLFRSIFDALNAFGGELVHHDIKPQNIVYNTSKRKMRLIDFGLMTTRNDILNSAIADNYAYPILHWSFPFELLFYNKSEYEMFAMNKSLAQRFYNELLSEFQIKRVKVTKNHEKIQNMRVFFNYMRVDGYTKKYNEDLIQKYWRDFYEFLMNMDKMTHEEFIAKSAMTIDLYGVGLTMATVFSATHKYLNPVLKSRLPDLIYSITTPNLSARLDVIFAISEYRKIFREAGLDIDTPHTTSIIPASVQTSINSIQLNNITLTPEDITKVINQQIPSRVCPSDKELNTKTGRCNKKCKVGYIRNSEFKCVKDNGTVAIPSPPTMPLRRVTPIMPPTPPSAPAMPLRRVTPIMPPTPPSVPEMPMRRVTPIMPPTPPSPPTMPLRRVTPIMPPTPPSVPEMPLIRVTPIMPPTPPSPPTMPLIRVTPIMPPTPPSVPLTPSPATQHPTRVCPPGKEMNPKTRRCNNVCKPGYIRDASFKCVSEKKTRKRRV